MLSDKTDRVEINENICLIIFIVWLLAVCLYKINPGEDENRIWQETQSWMPWAFGKPNAIFLGCHPTNHYATHAEYNLPQAMHCHHLGRR